MGKARLDYLAYADDMALLAKNSKDLQKMIDMFAGEASKVNLVLNLSKCKVNILGTELEEVEQYEYLGQVISNKNRASMSNELTHRIRKFWRAYHANKKILLKRKMALKLGMEIYKSTIRPVLTYACQTWSLKLSDKLRILRAERKVWRMILIKHGTQIYDKAKDKYLSNDKLKELRMRQPDDRPLKIIANWTPTKTRPGDRPCYRYFDCLKQVPDWRSKVNNSEEWGKVDYKLIT
uniref:Reverse transcriptase domain-containing protein n=1 Tax=Rhabditophanes sp. KR3021 TaxID=114890 RepID=A0AC35TSX1_9BILA